jgi:regulator of replication initiation timing
VSDQDYENTIAHLDERVERLVERTGRLLEENAKLERENKLVRYLLERGAMGWLCPDTAASVLSALGKKR